MKAPEITAMAIAIVVVCIPVIISGFTIISVKSGARTPRRCSWRRLHNHINVGV